MRASRLKPCVKCKGHDFVIDKHDVYRCYGCRVRHKRKAIKRKPYIKRAQKAKQRADRINRVPAWLTEEDNWMMREAHHLARLRTEMTGVWCDVDHIIPLNGKKVCGLHVPSNLQVITHSSNSRKGNKFEVE